MMITADMTLKDAVEFLKENIEKGCECPCCKRKVKLYKWQMNGKLVRTLAAIYKAAGREWIHIPTAMSHLQRNRIYLKLAFWGLATPKVRGDATHEDVGKWKVTELGIDFLEGRASVPGVAYVYNGKVLGFDTEHMIDVHKACKYRFDLKEIMGVVR